MSPEICDLVTEKYCDSTTAKLQCELVKAYFKTEPHLNIESYQGPGSNFRFGDSWARASVGAVELIPQLDPQDDNLIAEVINALEKKGNFRLDFLKNSKYAKAAAQYYYEKAEDTYKKVEDTPELSFLASGLAIVSSFFQPDSSSPNSPRPDICRPDFLAQALVYNPELAKQYPHRFIEYYLGKKEYENAFNLLKQLDDSKIVLNYLNAIPELIRMQLIQKDTPIAIILAKDYLEKKNYPAAQKFCSDIEFLNTEAAFTIAIRDKDYIKACELFEKLESSSSLSKAERKRLAETFFDFAESEIVVLKNSKYANEAAQYYYDKDEDLSGRSSFKRLIWADPYPGYYLTQALACNPELSKKYPKKFIEHHIGKKEYEDAFNLLEQLSDSKLVMNYLIAIPEQIRMQLIQKDTPIAVIVAKDYLEKKNYSAAQRFFSDIESLNPNAAFSIAIRDKDYIKAYELFKKLESPILFSTAELKKLAEVFFNLAEDEYNLGYPCRENAQWNEAKKHYLQSLEYKKNAFHLHESKEYLEDLYIHQRLYSQLIIDIDIDLNKPEKSEIENIKEAITLLRECKSSMQVEQKYNKAALASGLMRLVDTLREKIAFSKYGDLLDDELEAHKAECQEEISEFEEKLKELINLLKGSDEIEFRSQLGKAHYLLADVQFFLKTNASDNNEHYKLALEAVPDNPFYLLRVSEIFPNNREYEKNPNKAFSILKEMEYETWDYTYYCGGERWRKKDKIEFNIKDIHQLSTEPTDEPTKSSGWGFF